MFSEELNVFVTAVAKDIAEGKTANEKVYF